MGNVGRRSRGARLFFCAAFFFFTTNTREIILNNQRTLTSVIMALALLVAFLGQVTWALAGTTGGVGGTVTDEKGAPVPGASVKAISASQSASTTTDATGHFSFLSLAPDTYTVSLDKAGYEPVSYAGVTVFADNQLALSFKLPKHLIDIVRVTSKTAANLVKGGVGSDVYNVDSAAISNAAAIGGGGNLNSAYSAIASVPGVAVPQGGAGWNQPTFVRGSQFFFTGFEYDGIPVNRAFDNYNSSTESNLGLQELQVYTGGGPASNSSSGTSGFVNQVFKTGTYPGFGTLTGGIGGPTFYHQAKVEAGGASPDRRFSYYLGLSGYNQQFRFLDNNNGGALANAPTGVYTGQGTASVLPNINPPIEIMSECNTSLEPGTAGYDPNPLWSPGGKNWFSTGNAANGSCMVPFPGNYGLVNGITDRETVANFHFRIPRKNGTTDDLQLLGSASALITTFASSANDAGGLANYTLSVTGNAYCPPGASTDVYGVNCTPAAGVNYPAYVDAYAYSVPFGTPVSGVAALPYYQPSSPANRAFSAPLPANLRDTQNNDTGIVKLQYTHQLSSNAFMRVFGYTFFSDWTQAGSNSSWNQYVNGNGGPIDGSEAANYDLITHTAGGEIQFVDQINPAHLLELTGNYTRANVVRFNNTGFTAGGETVGLVSVNNGQYTCYNTATGAALASCGLKGYTLFANPTGTYAMPPAGPGNAAAAAGAQYLALWNGNAKGSYNTVKPQTSFISLSDQWRPSDKVLINASLRYDDFVYGLQANGGVASAFYAQIIQTSVCQNSSGGILTKTLLPGQPPPAPVVYTANCPAGYSHPNFSANSPNSYTFADLSPRVSMTYTQSPDTVWRGSIGRFTQPPISASVQYLNTSGNNLSVWNATLPLGFNTPFHPIPSMSATQADLSLERHIHGTDMSFKITPFYNFTVGYQEQSFIGPNFVTQTPVGNFRSTGVELAFSKGDFSKDGLSGQIALTYTNAKVQATNWFGNNQYNAVNLAINEFNKLTKSGGGSPFYCSGVGVTSASDPACTPTTVITNPYYNTAMQNTLTINGWYPGASTGISPTNNPTQAYFDVPWNGTLLLNYRKNKLAITPSFQLTQGPSYGGPLDVAGVDPRSCTQNALGAGITAVSPGTDPNACNILQDGTSYSTAAGKLFIPNPVTGSFNTPGQYRNPWELGANLAVTYDVSPKVKANLTVANLWHTCFGGSKGPWTTLYSPSSNVCGYVANPLYVSNFYNGTSMFDTAANGISPQPFQQQPYAPTVGGASIPMNVYFSLDIKL